MPLARRGAAVQPSDGMGTLTARPPRLNDETQYCDDGEARGCVQAEAGDPDEESVPADAPIVRLACTAALRLRV